MWRGASTMVAQRSNSASVMRLFYTVVIGLTLIHCTKGIPWTQEKVRTKILGGFVHKTVCKKWNLPHAVFYVLLSCNLPLKRLKLLFIFFLKNHVRTSEPSTLNCLVWKSFSVHSFNHNGKRKVPKFSFDLDIPTILFLVLSARLCHSPGWMHGHSSSLTYVLLLLSSLPSCYGSTVIINDPPVAGLGIYRP